MVAGGRNTISLSLLYVIHKKADETDLFEEISLVVGPTSRGKRTRVLHSDGKRRVWTQLGLS